MYVVLMIVAIGLLAHKRFGADEMGDYIVSASFVICRQDS